MPRRRAPDPLALRIGQRIRKLRQDAGLSLEKLAYESELGSKGHLSDVERGLTRPTVSTLKVLADRLGVALLDLVTFPEDDERQRLVDGLRHLPEEEVGLLARRYAPNQVAGEAGEVLGFAVGEAPRDRSRTIARDLGRRLREAREDAGRTEEAIAALAGLSLDRYLEIEEGTGDVSIRMLSRISDALGLNFWSLFR